MQKYRNTLQDKSQVQFQVLEVYNAWVSKQQKQAKRGGFGESLRSNTGVSRILMYATKEKLFSFLMLVMLGVIGGLYSMVIHFIFHNLLKVRADILRALSPVLGLLAYIIIGVCLAFFSTMACFYISSSAMGSGMAQIKAMLSGIMITQFFTLDTLIAKSFGLLASLSAGLSIGKEGPFVHIMCVITEQLMRLPMFAHIKNNGMRRLSMLAIACGVGISCNFGCVFGGVIFSIEVTATAFYVSNLPKAIFASLISATIIRLGWKMTYPDLFAMLTATDLSLSSNHFVNISVSIATGLICGVVSGIFVICLGKIVMFFNTVKILRNYKVKMLYLLFVVLLHCFLTYPYDFLRAKSDSQILSVMISTLGKEWARPSVYHNLGIFILLKFFLTLSCSPIPVPAGVFLPLFTLGSGIGRMLGELFTDMFPADQLSANSISLIGATSLAAAATGTLSTCIIAIEIVGNSNLLIPMLIAGTISYMVSRMLTPCVYDTISYSLGLPSLEANPSQEQRENAGEVCRKEIGKIERMTRVLKIKKILKRYPSQTYFPVVEPDGEVVRNCATFVPFCPLILTFVHFCTLSCRNHQLGVMVRSYLESAISHYHMEYEKMLKTSMEEHQGIESSEGSEEDSLLGDSHHDIVDDKDIPTLDEYLDRLNEFDFDDDSVMLPIPFIAHDKTHMDSIWMLFRMLGIEHVFVTKPGKLVGIITKTDIATSKKKKRVPRPQIGHLMRKAYGMFQETEDDPRMHFPINEGPDKGSKKIKEGPDEEKGGSIE